MCNGCVAPYQTDYNTQNTETNRYFILYFDIETILNPARLPIPPHRPVRSGRLSAAASLVRQSPLCCWHETR